MERRTKIRNNHGITLIALIISIIVMLILAGVSINAIVGDNGIINKAVDVTYMQACAVLEEYLQNQYLEYYTEEGDYSNKAELLANKLDLFFKDGSKNYITYKGSMYYVINKSKLPDELQTVLKGGDTTKFQDYIRLKDVYGVTSDLRVYYCADGTDTVVGNFTKEQISPSTVLAKINANSPMKDAVIDSLAAIGVNVKDEKITSGDVRSLKELTLDGSKYPDITNLSGISELRNLRKVTLKNLNLTSLDGLEYLVYLNYFYNQSSTIADYSKLASCVNLQYIYMLKVNNQEISNLSNGLKASSLTKLQYLGIFGNAYALTSSEYHRNSNEYSDVTDISSLASISEITRNSVKYLYIHNNKLTDIRVVANFKNLTYLECRQNANLTTLNGVNNLSSLTTIKAPRCNFTDISAIKNCDNLSTLYVNNNGNLAKLYAGNNISTIYAQGCKINNIEELANKSKLKYLQLESNSALVSVISLKNDTAIRNLYLAGNTNMNVADVQEIDNIIGLCGTNYTLPEKYLIHLTQAALYSYKDYNLTDKSDEITALKNKTKIQKLFLFNNTKLGASRLADLLKSGILHKEELETIKNNLTGLTEEEKNYITSLQSYTTEQLQALTDTQIATMENESDIYLRYLLSTLTNLQVLSLKGAKITKVDFVSKTPNLKWLDLRDTKAIDLSQLETATVVGKLRLGTIAINNTETDLSKFQTVISKLGDNYYDEQANPAYSHVGFGLSLYNNALVNKLSTCTNVTKLYMNVNGSEYGGGTRTNAQNVDLSACTQLKSISTYGKSDSFILPSSITSLSRSWTDGAFDNFSNVSGTISISYSDSSCSNESHFLKFCTSMSTVKCKVNSLYAQIKSATFSLNNFTDVFNPSSITTLRIDGSNANTKYENVDGLGKYTTLARLDLTWGKVNDILWISSLTGLKDLYLQNNNISNIDSLSNCTQLKYLNMQNNVVYSAKPLENSKLLETAYFNNNSLENSYTYESEGNIEIVDNIAIFKSLYKGNTGKLNILNLSGNPLTDDKELKELSWNYVGTVEDTDE